MGWLATAPISQVAPILSVGGSGGGFHLVVGLTGDGAAEHAGNHVNFLGPFSHNV